MGKKIISKSAKRRQVPKGSGQCRFTQQVVYLTPIGKVKGKEKFMSQTKHEVIS